MDTGGSLRKKKRLGDILIEQNCITTDQLAEALVAGKEQGTRLGETLVNLNMLKEIDIARALQKQLGIGFVSLEGVNIEKDILGLVDDSLLKKYCVMPFEFDPVNPNVLKVAMSDPMDIVAMDDLSIVTNLQIEPAIATPTDIKRAISKFYGDAEADQVAAQYMKERKQAAKKEEAAQAAMQ